MEESNQNITEAVESADNQAKQPPKKRRMPKWLRISLKTIMWTAATVIFLVTLLLCLIVWVLTPERLTPIVERVANDNLNAEITIGRAELTVWHTFPYMVVELEDVDVRSKALRSYKGGLPAGADSLLSVGRMRTSFNLARMPLMEFEIKEILVDAPKANIVVANDSLSNLMIFPTSAEEEKAEPSAGIIVRSIVVNKIRVTGNRGISYTDLRDGTNARIDTKTFSLDYTDDKFYKFALDGSLYAKIPEKSIDQSIPFAIKGDAKWDISEPTHCIVRNLSLNVADIPAKIDTDIKLDSVVTITKLDLSVGPVFFTKVLGHVPETYRYGLDNFDTDFSVSMNFHLATPYKLNKRLYPSFSTELVIPDCYIANRKRGGRINDVELKANLDFNGMMPHKSTLTISRILLDGFGIHIDASGKATNLLKDPNVDAKLTGSVDFAQILKLIPKEMPFRLSGDLSLDTRMKFAMSDFTVRTFHRIEVEGNATLRNVRYTVPSDSLLFFARNSQIRFGTNSEFMTKDSVNTSLLMASVAVDSLVFAEPGTRVSASEFKAGAGSLGGLANLRDTSRIIPIGARIAVGKFAMLSAYDSSRIRMRGMVADGSIRQFGDKGKSPLLHFAIKADRIGYSDPMTFLGLSDGLIDLNANIKQRSRQNRRLQARIDSLCRLRPDIPRDSVIALYRKRNRQKADTIDSESYVDLSIDNSFQRLFRRWDMNGTIKAGSGRLFTPYFPIRNRLDDLDLSFSTKKFDINSLTYRAGKSDLSIRGEINNIRNALLGSKRKPLSIKLDISSEMFDANELMAAVYKGSNFSNRTDKSGFSLSNVSIDDDTHIDQMIEQTTEESDSARTAIIIPKNIEAYIDLTNKRAVYTDFDFSDLRSSIRMKNGVLSVRDLSGKSDDGDLKLDLIYATANKNDIGMGLFLDLRDIKVGRFMTLMPSLDTIMPMLKGVDGVINARLAATTKVDSLMNVILPSTNAALNISGKDLVLLDSETFRQLAKMLRFKNKERNMIDSLSVEATAYNSQIDVYPFILRMDRYKLAVTGWNDFETNYKYHISVLDSPIFFKFGINLSGNFLKDQMKFRLGKAKLKEDEVARSTIITDTTKVNLFREMDEIFRRGAETGMKKSGQLPPPQHGDRKKLDDTFSDDNETLSRSDSLKLIEEGIIEKPDTASCESPEEKARAGKGQKQGKRKSRKSERGDNPSRNSEAIKPKNEQNNE